MIISPRGSNVGLCHTQFGIPTDESIDAIQSLVLAHAAAAKKCGGFASLNDHRDGA